MLYSLVASECGMSIQQRLFPEITKDATWTLVNLATLYAEATAGKDNKGLLNKPIVSDLKAQEELLLSIVEQQPTKNYTYGGFGEDRTALWFGTGTAEPAIHLGIDFNNLPAQLSVRSLTDGRVVHVLRDTDKINGWGGRVIIETVDKRYILYGHLDHKHLPSMDTVVRAGDEIGKIGDSSENGGWFCHLHLQYMSSEFVQQLSLIDGYAPSMPPGILDPMTL